jgi:nucleoside-diphosphate-sugar epimerase
MRAARRLRGQVEVVWGDLREPADVAAAVRDQDVIVHLAFIIPKLSATGVECESCPDWAEEINVGGTRHLLQAARSLPDPPKIIFTSSVHVFGRTQHQLPPRRVTDPVQPVEHYTAHKIACEQMVRDSGLQWSIFRLAATMPITMILDAGMFDVPLANRIEFMHTRDLGLALANGVSSQDIWGKLFLVGGGPRCQYLYREVAERVLEGMGVGMLPDEAFSQTPFCVDWMDTTESQQLLHYQQRDLGDYVADMTALLGFRRHLVRVFRPFVRMWLLGKSPYSRPPRTWWWGWWRRQPEPSRAN